MLNSGVMVEPDMPPSGPKRPDVSPKIRAVADDMAAIFGPAQRTDMVALPDRLRRDTPRRPRRGWLALLAAGGVVTMLAAGVVGGSNVLAPPAVVPTKAVRRAASPTPPPRVDTVAAPEPVQLAAAPMPSDSSASVPAADAPPPVTEPAARPLSPEPVAAPAPKAMPSRSEPRIAPDRDTRLATVSTRRTDCFDEASCLAPQLQAAERTVAVAYDRAIAAQVRAGTLRDYRDEWVRARRVALKRPREALRIYGMIISDLRLFADDASDGDRMVLR